MDGRLLHLLGNERGHAGLSFWPCFEPLRNTFDSYHWVVGSQPWFGWPAGFHDTEGNSDTCVHDPRIHEMLWRPGSISRWAMHFNEEFVSLWAPKGPDPIAMVLGYESVGLDDSFIEQHAAIWLEYTDSWCWEVFALDRDVLKAVDLHVAGNSSIRCHRTVSQNRRWGFSQAGWSTWPEP